MLVLVRHGQTQLNAEGRLAGRLDPPLTPLGERQARAAADAVRALGPPVRVVSSPLQRAVQTASYLGLPVEIDERWVEIDYGAYDGVKLTDVPPSVWARWRQDRSFTPPAGESLMAVGERVRAACTSLAEQAAAGLVVVVSHVSPIKAAVAWTLGVDETIVWRLYLAPASLTLVHFGEHGPSLHGFNLTAPPV